MNNELQQGNGELQENIKTQNTETVLENANPLQLHTSKGLPAEQDTPTVKEKVNPTNAITAKFSHEEMEYLQPVIDYHIKQGWASSKMDFLRKAVDFAVNLGHVIGKQFFGVPDGHQYKLLNKGFKDFEDKKIQQCK